MAVPPWGSLWTVVAPCANISRMTAVAPELAPVLPVEEIEEDDLILADVLVEEISIDGMCGVY